MENCEKKEQTLTTIPGGREIHISNLALEMFTTDEELTRDRAVYFLSVLQVLSQ